MAGRARSCTADTADEPRASRTSRRWRSGVFRRILIGGAILLALLITAYVAARVLVDAEFVESRAQEAVAEATDGAYELAMEAVEVEWLPPSLHARDVEFVPAHEASEEGGGSEAARGDRTVLTITAAELHLNGISPLTLAFGRELRADELEMRAPRITVWLPTGSDAEEDDGGSTASEGREADERASLHLEIAGQLPRIAVDRWTIREGSFSLRTASGVERLALDGVSARLEDVAIDSASARDSSRVLFSEAVEVRLPGYRRVLSDGLYLFEIGPVHASSKDSLIRAEGVRIAPNVSEEEFLRRIDVRRDRVTASVRELSLDALDFRGLLETGRLAAATVELDSFFVDVHSDKRLPPDPDSTATLPHESFRSLDRRVRLDTVRITDGHVRYAEKVEDAVPAGAITFEALRATIRNVTNDSARMSAETPAVVEADTRVMGQGRLRVVIRYDLLSPELVLSYRGGMGEMSATALNPMFLNIEGIEVLSGRVDTLWFDADLTGGLARGTFHGFYRDLQIEMLDRSDLEQDLLDAIKSFIAGDVMMHSRNPPEDEESPRTGTIEHRRQPDDPIFKYLWESLRSGIFSLIGL